MTIKHGVRGLGIVRPKLNRHRVAGEASVELFPRIEDGRQRFYVGVLRTHFPFPAVGRGLRPVTHRGTATAVAPQHLRPDRICAQTIVRTEHLSLLSRFCSSASRRFTRESASDDDNQVLAAIHLVLSPSKLSLITVLRSCSFNGEVEKF